jgi:hypothetical protein
MKLIENDFNVIVIIIIIIYLGFKNSFVTRFPMKCYIQNSILVTP